MPAPRSAANALSLSLWLGLSLPSGCEQRGRMYRRGCERSPRCAAAIAAILPAGVSTASLIASRLKAGCQAACLLCLSSAAARAARAAATALLSLCLLALCAMLSVLSLPQQALLLAAMRPVIIGLLCGRAQITASQSAAAVPCHRTAASRRPWQGRRRQPPNPAASLDDASSRPEYAALATLIGQQPGRGTGWLSQRGCAHCSLAGQGPHPGFLPAWPIGR